MKRFLLSLLLAFGVVGAAFAQTPQPVALPGLYTLAAGPDNLQANLPAAGYCYNIAWAVDRPGGAGFMAADCGATPKAWVTNAGPQGAPGASGPPGADGKTVLSGVGSPADGLGVNGDYYLDVGVTRLYGPKTSGAWGTGVSLIGPAGAAGATGPTGSIGPAGPSSFGTPNSRALAAATAYQATDTAKPAIVNINLNSSASLSLSGGTTNTADVVIGSTSGVASGTGTVICRYANTNTGALTIGLNLSTVSGTTCSFALPAGWFFAWRITAGVVTVPLAYDQPVG